MSIGKIQVRGNVEYEGEGRDGEEMVNMKEREEMVPGKANVAIGTNCLRKEKD